MRWQHPERGLVAPDRVHPARRGDRPDPAARPLGAARGLPRRRSRWRRSGPDAPALQVSVNVSARQLRPGRRARRGRATCSPRPACRRPALMPRDDRERPDDDTDETLATLTAAQGARRRGSPSTTSAPATPRWLPAPVPVDVLKIDRSLHRAARDAAATPRWSSTIVRLGQTPAAGDGGRGHRATTGSAALRRHGLHDGPGLPLLPAGAGRGGGGTAGRPAARRRRRRGADPGMILRSPWSARARSGHGTGSRDPVTGQEHRRTGHVTGATTL